MAVPKLVGAAFVVERAARAFSDLSESEGIPLRVKS
jgi:hypothetical protein